MYINNHIVLATSLIHFNLFRNSLIICAVNSATSILAGFAIFSVLGYIAMIQGQEVKDVVSQGTHHINIVLYLPLIYKHDNLICGEITYTQ